MKSYAVDGMDGMYLTTRYRYALLGARKVALFLTSSSIPSVQWSRCHGILSSPTVFRHLLIGASGRSCCPSCEFAALGTDIPDVQ